jgi:ABC-2 type transport system permease protein
MQSVVDEKENRTMEMIVTSVSPEALMAGKILGNLCVGLTQLLIWLLFAAFGALLIAIVFGYGYAPVILPIHLVLLFGVILPGFVLVAALMTLVGVTAASLREAQQVSILFTLPMVAPYWFAGAVLQNPNHPLSAFMSIFPLTAVITMPMRTSIGDVPDWQILLTVLLMISSAILSLWLAARIFRASMLNYGKRTSIKGVFFPRKKRNAHG